MSSAQVTIHRMTTTTTTTAVLLNIGYLKTLPGILKLFQIILGVVAVAIIGNYINWDRTNYDLVVPELFFLLVGTTCLITTTLLLLASLCSIGTASIMPKTLFESMYHVVAFLLYLAAGLTLIIFLTDDRRGHIYNENAKIAAADSLSNGIFSYLLLYASVYSLTKLVGRNMEYKIPEIGYDLKFLAGSIGLVNTLLYLMSSYYSVKTYRRG